MGRTNIIRYAINLDKGTVRESKALKVDITTTRGFEIVNAEPQPGTTGKPADMALPKSEEPSEVGSLSANKSSWWFGDFTLKRNWRIIVVLKQVSEQPNGSTNLP